MNKIDYLAYHDGLTKLYNRRFFDEQLKRMNVKRNYPLSIIMGDVNGLKLTNDTFGHAVGDRLLKEMSAQITKACREDDIVARWGGDEFIILLPKTNEKTASEICDRISIHCSTIEISGANFSISLGYETKVDSTTTIIQVLKSAEAHMYRKKSIGRSGMWGNTLKTMLFTFHEKNPRERLHSNRVSELSKQIAIAMDMPEKEVSEIGLIGLMHDIGKIAIDDHILNKSEKLSKEEWEEIQRHSEIGYRILSASNNMEYIANYVLSHHERLDGLGYPSGLKADDIPLQSKIIMIADSYDAMTSERPYKDSISKEEAIEELIKNSNTQFDSKIVDVFINKVLKMTNNKKNKVRVFDLIAPIYGLFYASQKKHYYILLDRLKKHVDITKYASIIDVGCGTGALCNVLKDKGLNVTGLDASLNMLNVGKRKKENSNIAFVNSSIISKTSFNDNSFNISIACHVAHGISKEKRLKMYAEMKRITKDFVIIYDYNKKRNLLVSIIEWFEGGDYFNFIKSPKEEMKQIFDNVKVVYADSHAAFYICH